jgi:Clp amino terminal domain, pathogenicity island component
VERRFTNCARQAIALASTAAKVLNHNWIDTQHLLLSLTRPDAGIAIGVLEALGINPDMVNMKTMEAAPPHIGSSSTPVMYTPLALRAIAWAIQEADRHSSPYVGTEHILLGLLYDPGGIAAQVLHAQGVDLKKARKGVDHLRAIRNSGETPGRNPGVVREFYEGQVPLVPSRRWRDVILAFREVWREDFSQKANDKQLEAMWKEAGLIDRSSAAVAEARSVWGELCADEDYPGWAAARINLSVRSTSDKIEYNALLFVAILAGPAAVAELKRRTTKFSLDNRVNTYWVWGAIATPFLILGLF